MSTTQRKQAPRPARPAARYWKGKAPKGVTEVHSDSGAESDGLPEGDGEHIDEQEEEEIQEFGVRPERDLAKPKGMNITLKDVSVSKEGNVIVAGRQESGRTAMEDEAGGLDGGSEEEKPAEQAGDLDESSEEESESEEEEKIEFRPVFVPKRARITIEERDALADDSEETFKKKEQQAEERRQESHNLVAQTIRRELAEKAKEEDHNDVDDTDGLDPEAEFEAWRLRELARIKQEKEAELTREREREEIERRRAMPEEQRTKEDLEHAKKLREEKPKGQQKFLQKYWHKGAFHQDEEILKRRDYTEATESTIDASLLPKVMQVKNFGKRSRTKYTHLVDQDTTVGTGGFGGHAPVKAGDANMQTGGCFLCGGGHLRKDCPQNSDRGPPTGANTVQLKNRRHEESTSRGQFSSTSHPASHWKNRDKGRHAFQDGDPRSRDARDDVGNGTSDGHLHNDGGYRPRRRPHERSVERHSRDKRRRLD